MIERGHTTGIPTASADMLGASVRLFWAVICMGGQGTGTGHKGDMSPASVRWRGGHGGHPPIGCPSVPPPDVVRPLFWKMKRVYVPKKTTLANLRSDRSARIGLGVVAYVSAERVSGDNAPLQQSRSGGSIEAYVLPLRTLRTALALDRKPGAGLRAHRAQSDISYAAIRGGGANGRA